MIARPMRIDGEAKLRGAIGSLAVIALICASEAFS